MYAKNEGVRTSEMSKLTQHHTQFRGGFLDVMVPMEAPSHRVAILCVLRFLLQLS